MRHSYDKKRLIYGLPRANQSSTLFAKKETCNILHAIKWKYI